MGTIIISLLAGAAIGAAFHAWVSKQVSDAKIEAAKVVDEVKAKL